MIYVVSGIALALGIGFVITGFSDRVEHVSNKDLGTLMILDGAALTLGASGTLLTGAWWPLLAAFVLCLLLGIAIAVGMEGLEL